MSENTEATPEAVESVVAPRTVFKVKDFVDSKQMKTDLAYSPNNLTDAMMSQASLFAHYGVEAAKASRQVDTVKMLLETTEAAVYRKIRDEFASKAEKVTEAQLEKMVARSERVLSMKRALNEARQQENVAKIAVEAFRHRRDMLVQQGLISREELKGELSVSAKRAKEDELESTKQAVLARRANRIQASE